MSHIDGRRGFNPEIYGRLAKALEVDAEHGTGGNVIFISRWQIFAVGRRRAPAEAGSPEETDAGVVIIESVRHRFRLGALDAPAAQGRTSRRFTG